jgi:hypothetical protein
MIEGYSLVNPAEALSEVVAITSDIIAISRYKYVIKTVNSPFDSVRYYHGYSEYKNVILTSFLIFLVVIISQ